MAKSSLEVEMLGTSFTVQSDADPRHLSQVVDYLKAKVKAIQASFGHYDPLKVCVLAGLNVVDELLRARQAFRVEDPSPIADPSHGAPSGASPEARLRGSGTEAEIERITASLIEKIDRSLLET